LNLAAEFALSYINNDTVAAPLKLGANDYIVKAIYDRGASEKD